MDFEAFLLFDRLLLLAFSLLVIGEPLRFLISKYTILFRGLDLARTCVVDVYLAGMILYAVAMVPLHLFSTSTILVILFICGTFLVIIHLGTIKNLPNLPRKVKGYAFRNKASLLGTILVFAMFLSLLWIEVVPLSNFVFGNIYDSSLFGLFTQLIIGNQQTPVTMQPFGTEGIIYPQGFFVIEAFACNLLGFSSAEITLRITPLFMALSVLGAYYLGKELSPRSHLDLSLAFTFWCISRWPRLLLWGSNAFVAGFPLFFLALSQLPRLRNLQRSAFVRKSDLFAFLIISILYGYLAAIHLVFFELLFAVVVTAVVLDVLRERKKVILKLRNFVFFCTFSILPIGVSVYRFIEWHPYIGHNFGLPSDVVLKSEEWVGGVPLSIILQRLGTWIFGADWISPHLVIGYLILGLFISGTVALFLLRNSESFARVKSTFKFALVLAAVSLLLILLTTNEMLSIFPQLTQFAMLTVQVAEMAILTIFAFFVVIAVFNIMLFHALQRLFSSVIHSDNSGSGRIAYHKALGNKLVKTNRSTIKIAVVLILILTAVYGPFPYYLFSQDLLYVDGQYKMFCVTTEDDYQLMLWMRGNLPSNSTILVNPHESGGFIPCISGHRVIYAPGASRYSLAYGDLVNLINDHKLNETTYELARKLNITHVFIGSSATPGRDRWDEMLFLGNPNFRLIKNIGKAYLFEVSNKIDLELVFASDFENKSLSADGWTIASSSYDGVGSAEYASKYDSNGASALKISAKNIGKAGERDFWYSIYRDVYVSSNSNVFLSFYVDVAGGFEGADNLMIILSDPNWTRQLFLGGIQNGRGGFVLTLPMRKGSYQFNISRLWEETHNSSLPTHLHLQFLNYDSDRIENVAYINNVQINVDGPVPAAVKFWDDFKYENLSSSGWLLSDHGSGNGLVTKGDDQFLGKGRLELDSESINGSYWVSIYKPIKLLWNSNSVMLRFKIDAKAGFGGNDGLAIIVCDTSWERHIYLATNPNATPVNHFINPIGSQQVNISDVWSSVYNQSLPETFFVQVLNLDSDGIKNVAYINLVQFEIPASSIGAR
jgi:hypothetical protein